MKFIRLALVIGTLILSPGVASAQLEFLQEWGNPGPDDPVAFPPPHAVAVGPSSRVYLLLEKRWTYVYQADGSVYTLAFTSLAIHSDLAVDDAENFYMSADDNTIKRYNSSGNLTGTFTHDGTVNELLNPKGVAVDGAGHLYVADSGNHRIMKLTTAGDFVDRWEAVGAGAGVADPVDVEVGPDGNVYVLLNGASIRRIQVYTSGGTFLREFDYSICGGADFVRSIALDAENNIFAAGDNCLTKFHNDGSLAYTFGEPGNGPGQFNSLYDVTVDAQGYIYTAESAGSRVQKFQEVETATKAVTWSAVKTGF